MTGAALCRSMAQPSPGMRSPAKAKVPHVGLELDQPAALEQAYENHKKSIQYLKGKFRG